MKTVDKKAKTFSEFFTDSSTGYIKIDNIYYLAQPVTSRKEVHIGVMVIYRRYGNIIKDVGFVDGIEFVRQQEHYTINSIPTSTSSVKSKLQSFRVKHLDFADITHILNIGKPKNEKAHSSIL